MLVHVDGSPRWHPAKRRSKLSQKLHMDAPTVGQRNPPLLHASVEHATPKSTWACGQRRPALKSATAITAMDELLLPCRNRNQGCATCRLPVPSGPRAPPRSGYQSRNGSVRASSVPKMQGEDNGCHISL